MIFVRIFHLPLFPSGKMMSELEQDIAAEIEALSGTTQESLIKSVSGEEHHFIKGEQNSVPRDKSDGSCMK